MGAKSWGFTGSSTAVTAEQWSAMYAWVGYEECDYFHHGDCVKADEVAHECVSRVGVARIVIHPPINRSRRAFCQGAWETEAPLPYLDRNRAIVDASDALLAMPDGPERQRSGTWSTVRYARKRGKPITFIWPDGSVTREQAA